MVNRFVSVSKGVDSTIYLTKKDISSYFRLVSSNSLCFFVSFRDRVSSYVFERLEYVHTNSVCAAYIVQRQSRASTIYTGVKADAIYTVEGDLKTYEEVVCILYLGFYQSNQFVYIQL